MHSAGTQGDAPRALIVGVEPHSPADDAVFSPGCFLTAVDGQPLRDIIDWRWLASGDEIEVSYIDLDGDAGTVQLWRDYGEDWGFEFEGLVFDRVRQCRNACTFCFMHQLPQGMRPSLYVRDDDFRLSFLVGTFVTGTNMTPSDEARIVEQRISPLRVSLQATNPEVRRRLIGKHAQHGIDSLERLLAAGIQFHAQIVLVPGENDGDVLRETLAWAYERPGILGIGIVPLGYTRHQSRFDHSFNSCEASRELLGIVAPFQERALRERGNAWVFAADEFYRNAWPDALLEHLPAAEFYGDFSMFEDGIGIIRSTVDDWAKAERAGLVSRMAKLLRGEGAVARMIAGFAQREFLDPLIARARIGDVFRPLYVRNSYFGGNVDVTGLLTGQDIVRALESLAKETSSPHGEAPTAFVPRVIFNDDGLTLDDMTLEDMERESGMVLHMVSCSPLEYIEEIVAISMQVT